MYVPAPFAPDDGVIGGLAARGDAASAEAVRRARPVGDHLPGRAGSRG